MATITRNSFIYQHMRAALRQQHKDEPKAKWTVRMYGVYNDLDDAEIEQLEKLWAKESR